MDELRGVRVAILITDGFEQVEMTEPRRALQEAGAETTLVSPADGKVKGWQHTDWGDQFPVDVPLSQTHPGEYDALLLPGGVINPDSLRIIPEAVAFVKAFFDAGKPVAAICHGPRLLAEADMVEGRTMTSWPSLKTDLRNAGAEWVDQEAVIDGNLVSARKPDDIPAFNQEMIGLFGQASSSTSGTVPGAAQRPL